MAFMINAGAILAANNGSLLAEPNAGAETNSGMPGWLTVVAIILALGGIGVAIYCYFKQMTVEAELAQLKRTIAHQKKQFEHDVIEQRTKIANLTSTLSNFKAEIAAMARPMAPAAPSAVTAEPVRVNTPAAPQPRQPQLGAEIKQYFAVPNNNAFSTPSAKFEPGRTLYCITTQEGSNKGTFEFCDDAASATIAKRSLTRFLESGCTTVGEQKSSFTRIRTVQPGTVTRAGAGWTIERKAQVELI
ncbi:MAG: hypothetical protein K2L05_04045 [Muribaculaceae bacterium]|nr:hypothetical protein [Muribaculaceae bacterium]